MNRAARAVLPVYKTFPIAALLRETGWGPVNTWLDRILDRFAVRIAAADPEHPLRYRWNSSHFIWIRRRQAIELTPDISCPPWIDFDRKSVSLQIGATGRLKGLESFHRWTKLRSPLDLTVFSDGALSKTGKAGAGYCVYRGSQEIISGQVPLGYTAQVYDAEIVGGVAGLRAACSHYMAQFATNVTVCLDNEEAAIRLHTGVATPTSSARIIEFHSLRKSWIRRKRATAINLGQVQVRWIPSHQGIIGNERADTLARRACNLETPNQVASITRAYKLLEDRYHEALALYWETFVPKRYKDLNIKISPRTPPELSLLPRPSLGRLLAARSGHGDFAAYHRRFKHNNADIYCTCGQEKSPEHPFLCQRNRRNKIRPKKTQRSSIEDDIKWTLSTTEGAAVFHKWCLKIDPYR